MTDRTLMRSQRNFVLECIKQTSLDPFNFVWSEVESKFSAQQNVLITVSRLDYSASPYYFIFDMNQDSHYCFYSPGEEKLHDQQFPGSWDIELNYVLAWLKYIEREVNQPDLWDDLARQKLVYDQKLGPEIVNEPFTVAQVEQINSGLENVRGYLINEFEGNQDAINLINEKLDYLTNAAKRQGRTDWFHTCIGVFLSVATALAMSPDQTRNIWNILKGAISGIIKLIPI